MDEEREPSSGRRPSTVLILGAVAAIGLIVAAVVAVSGSEAGYPISPPRAVQGTIEADASRIVNDDSAGPDPTSAEVVLTSESQALSLASGADRESGQSDEPVYLVKLSGDFVAEDVPTAEGSPPTGTAWYFMVDPRNEGTTDLGLHASSEGLGSLGVVTEVALSQK